MAGQASAEVRGTLGRYALFGEIASGGMATVHVARLVDPSGSVRTVALKRLHPHLAKDPDFVAMFLDEARLAARVHHPNVVATLDVVSEDSELFLVMEYVAGESLSRLMRQARERGARIPPNVVSGIVCAALEGLQAAHDATSERGVPLGIVHRDVSPQNIHVGTDGVARVLDFGIAKATNRFQETRSDQIKGKVQYMSPEQLAKGPIDRRADVYSAAVVAWEALTGKRLFKAPDVPALVYSIINDEVAPPSSVAADLPPLLDTVVMRGLDREASLRFASAHEMAVALAEALPPAAPDTIADWVARTAGEGLAARLELVHRIESETASLPPPRRSDAPSEVGARNVVSGVALAVERVYPEEEDRRETSMRLEVTAGTETRLRENKTRLSVALVAVLLLLAGVTAVVVRLVQLQREPAVSAPAPTAPRPTEEAPAIGLGAERPAASAPRVEAPAAKPAVSSPAAGSANECDNPFTVDAKGHAHPKPHCFKR